MYKSYRIMGIKLGEKPVVWKDLETASKVTGHGRSTITECVNNGRQTKKGWCFDYALD